MKKYLLLITIFCVLKANAQTYLISFTGTGASTTVATVKVENLTSGTTHILNGSDVLRLTGLTGINAPENEQSSELRIFPNPMSEYSTLQISPPVPGDAIISVFDMTGKQVAQIQNYLENSSQKFRLSGMNSGFYLISVKGNSYQYSGKLLSNASSTGTISIEKISIDRVTDEKKSNVDNKGTQATVDMAYTTGDRLKFTGISGIYSTVITDIPAGDKTITFDFIACVDGDNISYPVVEIGPQIWMGENLKTTKYRNGDLIGTTSPPTLNIASESAPKYQWAFEGNESYVEDYGRLYTFHAVTDNRNLCPTGWHAPTENEWTALTFNLGGEEKAGSKLKEAGISHWFSPNTGAINETGFTARPGGVRYCTETFDFIGMYGHWWSSAEGSDQHALIRFMANYDSLLSSSSLYMHYGASVRCIKDN